MPSRSTAGLCLYAVTSHSRDDDGNEKKSREKLVCFRIEGERVFAPAPVLGGGLKPWTGLKVLPASDQLTCNRRPAFCRCAIAPTK